MSVRALVGARSPGESAARPGEEGQKALDRFIIENRWMLFAAEQEEELDPVQRGINRSSTVAVNPHEIIDDWAR